MNGLLRQSGLGLMTLSEPDGNDITRSYYYGVNDIVSPLSAGWRALIEGASEFTGIRLTGLTDPVITDPVTDTPVDALSFKSKDGNPSTGNSTQGPALTPADIRNAIAGFYTKYYHRQADASGLDYWQAQVANGSHTLADVERAFATSPDMSPNAGQPLADYLKTQGITLPAAQTVIHDAQQIGAQAVAAVKSNAKPLLIGGVVIVGLVVLSRTKHR